MESTVPFLSPVSQSPENHFSFYHNFELFYMENIAQNNSFDQTQTLESAFSGLNVSGYPDLPDSGYQFGGGFARAGQDRNNNVIGEGTKVGPDVESWGAFMYSSYQLGSSRNIEFSILPSSNQTRLLSAAASAAGCTMPFGLNNNINRSSFNTSKLCNNNQTRHHWLHEPLNCLSLGDLRGRLVALAKDQYGCKFLQKSVEKASKEEIDMVFMEVIDHVCELMSNSFANLVVQKVVDVCSEEQKNQILLMVIKNRFRLVEICLNLHGARAVQKLLEKLTTQQQISLFMSALSPGAVALSKDLNGHRVIQYCLKNFSDEDNKGLHDTCSYLKRYDNEIDALTAVLLTKIYKCGCCALKHCLDHSNGEARAHLFQEIIANALNLAKDQYGNYVVQHILELKETQTTERLLRQLQGNYASLSCNRYGSNVVERCLLESQEPLTTRIIVELLRSPIVSTLLLDPFGNYVIQSALSVSKV
ncbi:hypothetical protein Gorai_012424 [Gossypium raimondii]|uniref:PUM-HD domain-containing protein n=1 Tax=Gossypium raimondii TaxID=29730 RepID=A0A7J8Q205_GOSRA|nr:hypothetical protein [Gossypium raimondii]